MGELEGDCKMGGLMDWFCMSVGGVEGRLVVRCSGSRVDEWA